MSSYSEKIGLIRDKILANFKREDNCIPLKSTEVAVYLNEENVKDVGTALSILVKAGKIGYDRCYKGDKTNHYYIAPLCAAPAATVDAEYYPAANINTAGAEATERTDEHYVQLFNIHLGIMAREMQSCVDAIKMMDQRDNIVETYHKLDDLSDALIDHLGDIEDDNDL